MATWTFAIPSFWWPIVSGLGSAYATNHGDFANTTGTRLPLEASGLVSSGCTARISGNTGAILSNGTQQQNCAITNFNPDTDIAVMAWTGYVWQWVIVQGGLGNPAQTINNLPTPTIALQYRIGSGGPGPWPTGQASIPETHAIMGW